MSNTNSLAINGGPKAVTQPLPAMYPGGLRIGAEEEEAVIEVIRSKRLFRYYGPNKGASKVEALEKAFASRMGVAHCVAVGSGTASLMAGFAGLGVGPGDEVIVPAYTWIDTQLRHPHHHPRCHLPGELILDTRQESCSESKAFSCHC